MKKNLLILLLILPLLSGCSAWEKAKDAEVAAKGWHLFNSQMLEAILYEEKVQTEYAKATYRNSMGEDKKMVAIKLEYGIKGIKRPTKLPGGITLGEVADAAKADISDGFGSLIKFGQEHAVEGGISGLVITALVIWYRRRRRDEEIARLKEGEEKKTSV